MNASRAWFIARRSAPWLALIGVLWWSWGHHGFTPTAQFAAGQQLPPVHAQLADGSEFDLQQARGKVLVLNFWASYCEPCRDEAPTLSSAQADDTEVVGLSIEPMSGAEVSRRARALGMRYRVGLAGQALINRFRVHTIPTTYVVGGDGVIVLSRTGPISGDELKDAVAAARRRTS